MRITKRRIVLIVGVAGAAVLVGAGVAIASNDDDAADRSIQGAALKQASEAALTETGGGQVTGTEVNDEDSYYEVEVTLDNGSQVDVQLDQNFHVVSADADQETDN
jgi:uncharacterized membrane protein YkoI